MVTLNREQRDGVTAYNESVRYVVSGATSQWGDNQRAEFIRIVAEAYATSERYARLWFTVAGQRRSFLGKDPNVPEWEGKVILAKCLVLQTTDSFGARTQYIQARPSSGAAVGTPLKTLLEEPFPFGPVFNWNFNGHLFNARQGDTNEERITFWLEWHYDTRIVPWWVPEELKPVGGIDTQPY